MFGFAEHLRKPFIRGTGSTGFKMKSKNHLLNCTLDIHCMITITQRIIYVNHKKSHFHKTHFRFREALFILTLPTRFQSDINIIYDVTNVTLWRVKTTYVSWRGLFIVLTAQQNI